jgi:hypothetical protein
MTARPKASGNVVPLHRGAYTPDFPLYIVPRPHTGAELSRMVGDPDAVFARLNGPAVHYRIGGCPRWLDVLAKAFIIAAGIVSVALWVAAL